MDSIYLLDCVKATENALDLVGVYWIMEDHFYQDGK